MTNWKRCLIASALPVAATIVTSCAAMRGAQVRQEYIRSQTVDFIYERPIAEVWAAARQLLFLRGYELQYTGEGGSYIAETRWRVDGTVRSQYWVQAIELSERTCQLNFSYSSGATGQDYVSTRRDLDTEWVLLQQLEPGKAAQIAAEAEQRAAAARGS
jgi:hypothetical protein